MTDVVGYRVLRTAARGMRCRLLVGHRDGATVVIKIAEAGDAAFAREAEALERGRGEHVVALRDAGTDDGRSVLVLERLGGGTLGDLLDRRGALGAGEVVTLLAPIASTLDRLHEVGIAHGDLSLEAVCLSDDGAPTLVGFGRAEIFAAQTPEVVREAVPGVVADRAALRAMAGMLLARVAGPRAESARRLAASLDGVVPADLAAALFDLAVPEPVAVSGADEVTPRVVDAHEVPEPTAEAPALPPWVVALLPDPVRERATDLAVRGRAVWSGWASGRRRLVIGGLAGVVAVGVALAVVPSAGSAPVADATPAPEHPSSVPPGLPDDPLDAAAVLVAQRERCIRDLSVLCLDAVDQVGSAAYDEDRALILTIDGGGEVPAGTITDGELALVERLGDSALIELPPGSEPASLLLLRTAEGWRIRDYFPGRPEG